MIDKNAYGYYSVKCGLGEMVASGLGYSLKRWVVIVPSIAEVAILQQLITGKKVRLRLLPRAPLV